MLGAQQSPGRVVLTEQVQGSVVESQKCTIDFWWNKCRWKRAGFEAEVKAFSPFISIAFFRSQFHGAQTFGFFLRQEKISDIFFPEKKGHAILRIRGIASINKGH